jgi:hypothetical protein
VTVRSRAQRAPALLEITVADQILAIYPTLQAAALTATPAKAPQMT